MFLAVSEENLSVNTNKLLLKQQPFETPILCHWLQEVQVRWGLNLKWACRHFLWMNSFPITSNKRWILHTAFDNKMFFYMNKLVYKSCFHRRVYLQEYNVCIMCNSYVLNILPCEGLLQIWGKEGSPRCPDLPDARISVRDSVPLIVVNNHEFVLKPRSICFIL